MCLDKNSDFKLKTKRYIYLEACGIRHYFHFDFQSGHPDTRLTNRQMTLYKRYGFVVYLPLTHSSHNDVGSALKGQERDAAPNTPKIIAIFFFFFFFLNQLIYRSPSGEWLINYFSFTLCKRRLLLFEMKFNM